MEDRGSYDVSTIVIELQYRTKQVEDMKDEINWLRGECSKLNNQFLLQSPPKLRWFWKR